MTEWKERGIAFHGLWISLVNGTVDNVIDRHEYTAARKIMRQGDRVLVAGNGMGSVAVLLGAEFGRESVVGVEPHPMCVAACRHFVSFESGPMHVVQGALGTKSGMQRFYLSDRWAESTLQPDVTINPTPPNAVIDVQVLEVNYAVREYAVNGMVLDVEGAEHEILPALDFSPLRWLVCEIHGHDERAEPLMRLVKEAGFAIETFDLIVPDRLRVIGAVRG